MCLVWESSLSVPPCFVPGGEMEGGGERGNVPEKGVATIRGKGGLREMK